MSLTTLRQQLRLIKCGLIVALCLEQKPELFISTSKLIHQNAASATISKVKRHLKATAATALMTMILKSIASSDIMNEKIL
ncbi:CLUMA_CG001473, isoform A [Clunio marinus]|uniref:CLUMA_CG001473, isoform A n=1 Tax=Clunio marinus TaxID=568069 RepID=A0A1J1HJE2_9DIPT|nr:CLUMA_CG001473, isoform A [Clunio marinus]